MERSFCFNSINGDRKYKAEDFREYFATFIGNGVFPNPSTNLQCIGENEDMTVTLKVGNGWIDGALYVNDNDLILPIDVADGVLNRIDRIVLRMDTVGRAINAVVKKGTFASSPVAPELQRDADAYEIGIADIYVAAGATQITQANITDLRLDTSLCGIVHGTVEQADTTTLFNQYLSWLTQKKAQYDADMLSWTAQKQVELNNYISGRETDFNTWYNNITSASQTEIDNMEAHFQQDWNNWFATVQSALDGDTAGNLLNLINTNTSNINSLAGTGRTTETVKGNADAIANLTEDFDEHKADYVTHPANAGTTEGTSTAYTITTNPVPTILIDKIGAVFTVHTDSGSNPTLKWGDLEAKPIKKPNGNSAILKSGGIYTVRYNATSGNFILQGEGASGNATASDLLSGKTASTDAGDIVGTMPNNGVLNYIPSSSVQTIPTGYTSGGTIAKGYNVGSVVVSTNIDISYKEISITDVVTFDSNINVVRAPVNRENSRSEYTSGSSSRVVVGLSNGDIVVVDTVTKSIVWQYNFGTSIIDLDYRDGYIYAIINGDTLKRIDCSNGTVTHSIAITDFIANVILVNGAGVLEWKGSLNTNNTPIAKTYTLATLALQSSYVVSGNTSWGIYDYVKTVNWIAFTYNDGSGITYGGIQPTGGIVSSSRVYSSFYYIGNYSTNGIYLPTTATMMFSAESPVSATGNAIYTPTWFYKILIGTASYGPVVRKASYAYGALDIDDTTESASWRITNTSLNLTTDQKCVDIIAYKASQGIPIIAFSRNSKTLCFGENGGYKILS